MPFVAERGTTKSRVVRFSLLGAVVAVVAAAILIRSSAGGLVMIVAGLALTHAGFQVRAALEGKQPETTRRARWLAAFLFCSGAIVTAVGLAMRGLLVPSAISI